MNAPATELQSSPRASAKLSVWMHFHKNVTKNQLLRHVSLNTDSDIKNTDGTPDLFMKLAHDGKRLAAKATPS